MRIAYYVCNIAWLDCGDSMSNIYIGRADSWFEPSQWETVLLCNDISHWLGANMESALYWNASVVSFIELAINVWAQLLFGKSIDYELLAGAGPGCRILYIDCSTRFEGFWGLFTCFVLCRDLVVLVDFTHIHLSYISRYVTGTRAIIWLTQCQWSDTVGYGSMYHMSRLWTDDIITTKQSIFNGMYCSYCQTSNISHTVVSNKIVDHSDVVGASPVSAAPTTSSFLTQQLARNRLRKDNSKTRRETLRFWDLMWLILEVWQQSHALTHWGWVTHIYVGNLVIIGSDNGLSPITMG